MKEKLLIIKNDLSELETIASSLDCIAEEWNFKPKLVFQINLVIEEVVTNTISYGYGVDAGSEHEIKIHLSLDGNLLTLIIIDGALAFDPLKNAAPQSLDKSIEEREIGGLGIFMVKELMDELEYKWENERNILILKKNIADTN